MKERKVILKITFILTVILFLGAFSIFIAFRMREPKPIEADFSAVRDALSEGGYLEGLEEGTALRAKASFSLLPGDYEEMLYLVPSYYLDVDEILLVKLPEGASAADLKTAMEAYLERTKKSFENYGTDQFSILQDTVIYQNAPYVLYCAGRNAREASRLIRSMIER